MEECIYCGAVGPLADHVPDVGDDEAWDEEAANHNEECEWVQTRAHRRGGAHGDD